MQPASPTVRHRGRRALTFLLVLGALSGFTWGAMALFSLGFSEGLMAGGGALVVYMVPATILDWPRPSLADILAGLWDAMTGFLATIFGDW